MELKNQQNENAKNEKENQIGNYQIGNYIIDFETIIAKGSFGTIFKGFHYKSREPVAIKSENSANTTLRHETRILQHLYENHVAKIPQIYWYGTTSIFNDIKHQVLILPFYSCNLEIFIKNKTISENQLSALMLKCINIIQSIHRSYVVHRDIKPANFMIKNGDIYLIDFGLATFYLDENAKHVEDDKICDMVGTLKYASIHIHIGHRFSRRDDIISLIYMYDYLANGGNANWAPVQQDKNQVPTVDFWLQSKKQYLLALCREKLQKLYEIVYSIEYKEEPNYLKIKMLFEQTI
jgi:serine/threonine protein kinase